MKSFFRRKDFEFLVLPRFFIFFAAAAFLPFSLNAQSAPDIEALLASFGVQSTSSGALIGSTTANIIASSTEMKEDAAANAAAERKKAEEEQRAKILQQIQILRGVLPNSTIDALEKKYQIGAYSPKPASLAPAFAQKTAATATSGPVVFLRNLKQGDSGEDVRALQKILNKNADTQIAGIGTGSPGNETDYFGALTKAAVVKFQNKYSAEILVPNGLSVGTGFVGLSTRVVLNDVAGGKSLPAPSPIKTQAKVPTKVSYCEPVFAVLHGTELTASENASIACVTANTKETCETADTYTQSTATLGKDGTPDCRWVIK